MPTSPPSPSRTDDGYTLTEMLVVIAIIALIAAVLTPGLINQMARARAKAAELQLQTVASAIEAFRSDVGRYPTESEGVAALIKEPGSVDGWTGPYLKDAKANNDPWGRPLQYHLKDEGHFYIRTFGADGKPGGSGVDRDLTLPAQP